MVYHQFITIGTHLKNVCYGFRHISNKMHMLMLFLMKNCVPKRVTISVICKNLFTKHLKWTLFLFVLLSRRCRRCMCRASKQTGSESNYITAY